MFGIGIPMIIVGEDSLYSFTEFTFTNAAATGRYGPTLVQCQTAYAGQVWLASYFTMSTQGYQLWTVPTTGTYRIEISGARGARVSGQVYTSGRGVKVRGDISLTKGDVLTIIVGQYIDSPNTGNASTYTGLGGGGGSFVAKSGTILIAAGGGGGASTYTSNSPQGYNGGDGLTTTSGGYGDAANSLGAGGTGGGGGTVYTAVSSQMYRGGAGAGWSAVGQNGNGSTTHPFGQVSYYGEGGFSYSGGFIGGDYNYSWGNPTAYASTHGGFGGGGGGNGIISGGAGGGYSGGGIGGAGSYIAGAGGGGSYIVSTATNVATSNGQYAGSSTFNGNAITNLSSYNEAMGYVKITRL
jgi:hypothetical protein